MPVRTARVCLTAAALRQSSDVRKAARASYWKLVSRLEGLAHFSSHRNTLAHFHTARTLLSPSPDQRLHIPPGPLVDLV